MLHELERGVSYIIVEEVPRKSYRILNDYLEHGYIGLCLTVTEPKVTKKKWKIRIPIIWVTKSERAGHQAINPERLNKIGLTIGEFLKSKTKKKKIIMLDCMELLINSNDFNEIMKFLHPIIDFIFINNAILIVPLNLSLLDKKQVGYLEREFKVLKEELFVSQLLENDSPAKN